VNSDYVYQPYPSVRYHWSGKTQSVNNAEEDAALSCGWAETPAAFQPYIRPRQDRSTGHDPLRWVEEWQIEGVGPHLRRKIKARLLRADTVFEQASDKEAGMIEAMRRAFRGIASVLFKAGLLTEEMLRKQIPELVWDSAISAEWWRRAADQQSNVFPYPAGHYWVWVDSEQGRDQIFRAELRRWTAALLDSVADRPVQPAKAADDRLPTQLVGSPADDAPAERDEGRFAEQPQRMSALEAYIKERQCSEAALARAANVDPADLSKWKTGQLPKGSDKKARIERALRTNVPPVRDRRKSRT